MGQPPLLSAILSELGLTCASLAAPCRTIIYATDGGRILVDDQNAMQKITPHLWFDRQAREAAEFYVSLFPGSKISNVTTLRHAVTICND
jgi:3-demethylubiquinone-9 3-methyltransferase